MRVGLKCGRPGTIALPPNSLIFNHHYTQGKIQHLRIRAFLAFIVFHGRVFSTTQRSYSGDAASTRTADIAGKSYECSLLMTATAAA